MIGYLNLFSPSLTWLVSLVFFSCLSSFFPSFRYSFCVNCSFVYCAHLLIGFCAFLILVSKSTVCVTEINPSSRVCSFPPVYLLALVTPFFWLSRNFINFALLDCHSFPLWFYGFRLCIEKLSAVLRFFKRFFSNFCIFYVCVCDPSAQYFCIRK